MKTSNEELGRWGKVSMDYLKPLRYMDIVEVKLKIRRIMSAATEYQAEFFRCGLLGNEKVVASKCQAISCLYGSTGRVAPEIVAADLKFLEKIEIGRD